MQDLKVAAVTLWYPDFAGHAFLLETVLSVYTDTGSSESWAPQISLSSRRSSLSHQCSTGSGSVEDSIPPHPGCVGGSRSFGSPEEHGGD
jgi:hypothetical protein